MASAGHHFPLLFLGLLLPDDVLIENGNRKTPDGWLALFGISFYRNETGQCCADLCYSVVAHARSNVWVEATSQMSRTEKEISSLSCLTLTVLSQLDNYK